METFEHNHFEQEPANTGGQGPVRPARTTFRVQRLPSARQTEGVTEARGADGNAGGTPSRPGTGTRGGETAPASTGRQLYVFPRHLLTAPPPKLPSRREAPRRPANWSDRRWERWLAAELERAQHRRVLRAGAETDEAAQNNGDGEEGGI